MTVDDDKFGYCRQMAPIVIVDGSNQVIWRNHWAESFFGIVPGAKNFGQLVNGEDMTAYAEKVRRGERLPHIRFTHTGMIFDVEAHHYALNEIVYTFHPTVLLWDSMLEMHKFMQDFALATGDKINNPLTTVLNCLQLIRSCAAEGRNEAIPHYVGMAMREALAMKDFSDWVRRLSEEPLSTEVFDLVTVLKGILANKDFHATLQVAGDVPFVIGDSKHASSVLGSLVNLCQQRMGKDGCNVKVFRLWQSLVTVEISPHDPQIYDLRMLIGGFYGGLGLLAVRYLLSQMQAQITLDYKGESIRVTFLSEDVL